MTPAEKTVPYIPMTVPRDRSSLTLFNQTSLAIQLSPIAQPVMNLKTSQKATFGHAGMAMRTKAAVSYGDTRTTTTTTSAG